MREEDEKQEINLEWPKATGLILFHCLTPLQTERCLFAYRSTCNALILHGLTIAFLCVPFIFADSESVDYVVACDGFLRVTEIIHIFHSGYIDCRGAFQKVPLYCYVSS